MNSKFRMFDADSSDEHIVDVLTQIKESAPADEAVAAELARILANSGEKFATSGGLTADVASTGGPSSLTTLLCPLYLRASGLLVPKLGVPGRPAGGIDCLAQIQGFKVELTQDELRAVMASAGYAHFLAAGRYAPLDARVFKLRQQYGAQDVPTLVASSLLSKKLAVGVRRAGLDIRVAAHGNFGKTWSDALDNARLFAAASRRLGVDAFPVLTNAAFPYQQYIGRREALAAMSHLFDGTASAWLRGHSSHCLQLALAAAPADRRKAAAEATPADLERHFLANLEAQGATAGAFDSLVRRTRADHKHVLNASADGFVSYFKGNVSDGVGAHRRD